MIALAADSPADVEALHDRVVAAGCKVIRAPGEQVSPGVFNTVGRLRSRGIEVGINGNITPKLALFGGYSYIDARVTSSATAANIGLRFPNIPAHSGSLLATYAITDGFTLGGQAYCQSSVNGGSVVAGSSTLDGYCRFDAVARLKVREGAELRVNVLNLANKTYYEAIYTSGSPFSFVAPGRSANVTLSVNF